MKRCLSCVDAYGLMALAVLAQACARQGAPSSATLPPAAPAPPPAAPVEPPIRLGPQPPGSSLPFSYGPQGLGWVTAGEPAVTGALGVKEVEAAAHARINDLFFCYERALTQFPGLRGRIEAHYSIASDGSALDFRIQHSTLSQSSWLEVCVMQVFQRNVVFPKPDNGVAVSVSQSFDFAPLPSAPHPFDPLGQVAYRPKGLGQVTVRAPAVRGALRVQEVQRVARAQINNLIYCYERALKRAPSLRGRVEAHYSIAPDGRVMDFRVERSALSARVGLEICVMQVFPFKARFPKPDNGAGVSVSQSFDFAPHRPG